MFQERGGERRSERVVWGGESNMGDGGREWQGRGFVIQKEGEKQVETQRTCEAWRE